MSWGNHLGHKIDKPMKLKAPAMKALVVLIQETFNAVTLKLEWVRERNKMSVITTNMNDGTLQDFESSLIR